MKNTRQNVILQIITEQEIETQAQLIDALAEHGIASTQATLSRDIKELHLVKELGSNGRHHYAVSGKSKNNDHEQRLSRIFRETQPAQRLTLCPLRPSPERLRETIPHFWRWSATRQPRTSATR